MTAEISRKEFFRQALISFGKTALNLTETVNGKPSAMPAPPETTGQLPPGPDMVAEPSGRCLAANCGCLACVERCEPQAIMPVAGEGIRIDQKLCTGCGSCEYVCPVSPKAVVLKPRETGACSSFQAKR